ncbi:cupin domain-containing protein [Planomicrobium sp. CPCC 101079]|uniref:cupin domain-containing protein n=1 Tax=Planomicrobium sp. CPCC 101079 TaxID=2599618 RepID=UPI0011B53BDB|nr:cupin domain-containing protein [Planomicrobium sp. CPCC 101079]TWT01014.1 cupin domain-containing protein [Planomicrobium sp. CPCC 101079]
MSADFWIEQLQMEKHPEGGYFKQSFKSKEIISPESHPGIRNLYTSIYFLLRSENISHFHQLKSDELWYFHAGSSLTVHIIGQNGTYRQEKLGLAIEKGEKPQVLVEKGSIFGSSVDTEGTFSLVGCMVSPGFDFADFKLFSQAQLIEKFPQHEKVIRRLAYEQLP